MIRKSCVVSRVVLLSVSYRMYQLIVSFVVDPLSMSVLVVRPRWSLMSSVLLTHGIHDLARRKL